MMRWAIGIGAALVSFFLLILMSMTMAIGSIAAVLPQFNQADDVPIEMEEMLQDLEQELGIPMVDLAAYLAVRYQWQLPVPTRGELAAGMPEFGRTIGAEHIEAMWQALARRWLEGHLAEVGADLAGALTEEQRDEYEFRRAALEVTGEIRQTLTDEDRHAWTELTEGETYRIVLSLREWPYACPVPGASFIDDWGFDRPQNEGVASTRHHGTDLFAPRGSPVYSATAGEVIHRRWNLLGGYTVTIRDDITGVLVYYAHLDGYAPDLTEGQGIQRGQLIGWVGTTGEGPERTDNVIADPHLHLGIYLPEGAANPYPYVSKWCGR